MSLIPTRCSINVIIVMAVVGVCLAAYFPAVPARFADFRAFYCSGRAVLGHADPYREHPLHECERAVRAPGVSQLRDDVAIPAPFPGYALAVFALLALLPFGVAAASWLVASLVALAFSVTLVAHSLQIRVAAVAVAVGFPMVVAAVRIGQATPFIVGAMALTAYLLVRDKPRSAAISVLAVAIEPHVALAILVALFIGERRTRLPLVAGSGVLLALSMTVLGGPLNIEYLRAVLPAHALADIPDLTQFSFAHFVYILGMDAAQARLAGSGWYAIASTIGIIVALRLRVRFGAAALVFVPPAFEVFGGVHVHIAQLALAVPGFLLLLAHSTRWRPALAGAVFWAAQPWFMIANFPMLVPAIAVLAIAFAISMDVEPIALALAISAALLALGLFGTFLATAAPQASVPVVVYPTGNPLAEASWSVLMRARHGYPPMAWFIAAKVPTIAAFSVLLAALCSAARRSFGATRVRRQRVKCSQNWPIGTT